jgi:plastocyanin
MMTRRPGPGSSAAPSLATLALLALVLGAGGCAGTKGSSIPVTEVTAKPNAEGVQVVDVEAHSYYYKPSRIVVEAGRPVELVVHFKNLIVPHNLTCDYPDAGINIDVGAGFLSFHRVKRVRFTPKTPGEYRFYCNVGSHMMKGMTGTLVVRE